MLRIGVENPGHPPAEWPDAALSNQIQNILPAMASPRFAATWLAAYRNYYDRAARHLVYRPINILHNRMFWITLRNGRWAPQNRPYSHRLTSDSATCVGARAKG